MKQPGALPIVTNRSRDHGAGRIVLRLGALLILLLTFSCTPPESGPPALTADMPLHLEEHLEAARIHDAAVPEQAAAAMEWRFDQPQPDWKPLVPRPGVAPVTVSPLADALRLTLSENNRYRRFLNGWIFVDLPDLKPEDWAYVAVRARTSDKIRYLGVRFEPPTDRPGLYYPGFLDWARIVRPVDDGGVQSYLIPVGTTEGSLDTWQTLGIEVAAPEPASIDLVGVSLLPNEAAFTDAPVGTATEARNGAYRHVLYVHAPGRVEYPLRVPSGGRLDFAMGVVRAAPEVTFRVTAAVEEGTETLFEEPYGDHLDWAQRRIDLSSWTGRTITLGLAAESADAGNVALWAAPTVSGSRAVRRPNVIVYIIDGGAAEYMSLHGYNRRTTPHLERLAAQGAVFENAYSIASWTKPSSMSFMTSLTPGMLGGYKDPGYPVPAEVMPMAEQMHRVGYQTALFTANPWCGTMSGLERGVDVMRETLTEPNAVSSRKLNELFRQWRQDYPGEPYWVHFQTIDVHPPLAAVDPFAGLYLSRERREAMERWERRLEAAERGGSGDEEGDRAIFDRAGIDPHAYNEALRDAYDEAMAHNDYQIGKLVERLRTSGEWERTLLIVAADHGWPHLLEAMQVDNPPPRRVLLNPFNTRVPLVFVWPGRIPAGQRLHHQVSMLDLLPTVLDLVGLPHPEGLAGQSLAPLLLGREGWEPRPVPFEEVWINRETGEPWGMIETIDGRWGASFRFGSSPYEEEPPPEEELLLLYDLWNDPYCQRTVNDERPDLVAKYTELLAQRFGEHWEIGSQFPEADQAGLSNEQLEQLRSLGYLQ